MDYDAGSSGRFRLEHRRTVTTPAADKVFLVARPRSLAHDPAEWPLPLALVASWVLVRQVGLRLRRQPGWQLDVCSNPVLEDGKVIAVGSRSEMLRRLESEAAARAS